MHVPGIEPESTTWQAVVIPLDHTYLVTRATNPRRGQSLFARTILPFKYQRSGHERSRTSMLPIILSTAYQAEGVRTLLYHFNRIRTNNKTTSQTGWVIR